MRRIVSSAAVKELSLAEVAHRFDKLAVDPDFGKWQAGLRLYVEQRKARCESHDPAVAYGVILAFFSVWGWENVFRSSHLDYPFLTGAIGSTLGLLAWATLSIEARVRGVGLIEIPALNRLAIGRLEGIAASTGVIPVPMHPDQVRALKRLIASTRYSGSGFDTILSLPPRVDPLPDL